MNDNQNKSFIKALEDASPEQKIEALDEMIRLLSTEQLSELAKQVPELDEAKLLARKKYHEKKAKLEILQNELKMIEEMEKMGLNPEDENDRKQYKASNLQAKAKE